MIYDENHNGIQLTALQVGAFVNNQTFQGFFTKADLNALVAQPNVIGVRVYNAKASATDTSRRLVAVGVWANGGEESDSTAKYVLSQPFDANTAPSIGTQKTKTDATSIVELAVENPLPPTDPRGTLAFASYFSKAMLANLLATRNGTEVAGIGFYVAAFGANHSHVGVPYSNGSTVAPLTSNSLFPVVQCDNPCPSHCAYPAEEVTVLTPTTETVSISNASKTNLYLLKWDN